MKISELPKYELQSEEILRIEEIINKYKGKKGALIPTLHDVQNEVGFLPIEVQKKVAKDLNIPEKEVYGVVTFYSFFSLIPRGRNNIRVCLGTACFVKGGKKIADKISKELGIKPGQTTADRQYSIQVNRCLGACGIAPIIVINEKIYQKVKPEEVMDIIYSHK
ncbi:MAG: NADH-quinone oxidoreductase subunit NuoE [Actinobacteria bacterium]|nr:NADH-quinone oxidoreductase subunit NuoE [Actinomycetota bacterium]